VGMRENPWGREKIRGGERKSMRGRENLWGQEKIRGDERKSVRGERKSVGVRENLRG